MMINRIATRVALLLTLAIALLAVPVMAQGKGNGNGRGKAQQAEARRGSQQQRPELQRRAADDDDSDSDGDSDGDWDDDSDGRYTDRNGNVYGGTTGRRQGVPPGWCQGRGNPHNTVENCGYTAGRSSNGTYRASRSGSHAQQHAEFHRYLDQKYSALAARNPLDIRRQIELRSQKSAEHQRWHAQTGTRHEDL